MYKKKEKLTSFFLLFCSIFFGIDAFNKLALHLYCLQNVRTNPVYLIIAESPQSFLVIKFDLLNPEKKSEKGFYQIYL